MPLGPSLAPCPPSQPRSTRRGGWEDSPLMQVRSPLSSKVGAHVCPRNKGPFTVPPGAGAGPVTEEPLPPAPSAPSGPPAPRRARPPQALFSLVSGRWALSSPNASQIL